METINTIDQIRPSSIKELADIYGVCDRTFKKWIKPFDAFIGEKHGRYFSVAQVKVIFEKLGVPCRMSDQ